MYYSQAYLLYSLISKDQTLPIKVKTNICLKIKLWTKASHQISM